MVQIHFELEPDEDGFPPVSVESLSATPLGNGIYRIEAIPFFVEGIALGDTVSASKHEGELWFDDVEDDGGHSTVQIIIFEQNRVPELQETLSQLGCTTAASQLAVLIAVDIPPGVNWKPIQKFLDEGEAEDYWTYKEAAFAHED